MGTRTISLTMSTEVTASDRRPTMRSISSTLSVLSSPSSSHLSSESIDKRISLMVERANKGTPLTEEEIEGIEKGLKNLSPIVDTNGVVLDESIDYAGLRDLLIQVAHLSHKDWDVTSKNSDLLGETLSIGTSHSSNENDTDPLGRSSRQLLERILTDGNWDGAIANARDRSQRPSNDKSWAVLVTGVNGIRKTTSIYQPWFPQLLFEALVQPSSPTTEEVREGNSNKKKKPKIEESRILCDDLPTGSNSFFRQLDHMICTLCNEEFARLYAWSASQLPKVQQGEEHVCLPSDDVVEKYSNYKAAIFSRFRTISELLGALLLKQAQKVNINCMVETSGRDISMFHYVDQFFGENNNYNKLALHFTINDLVCAQQSVDRRMIDEIQAGAKAIENGDVFDIIYTNQGGPYGSKVLESVQKDSDRVWEQQVITGNVGKDWYKATIAISAHQSEPWTAQAVKPDGSLGTKYTFEPR